VLIAAWTAGAIPALFAPEHAALLDVRVQRPVMWLTLAIGAITGIVCGLLPAVASTRALSPAMLRGDAARIGDGHGAPRLRMVLVGAQLALSTLLLVVCAVLAKGVDAALQMDLSQAAGSLLMASIESPEPDYRRQASEGLRRQPWVDVAGWIVTPPLGRAARREYVIARGPASEPVEFDLNFASSEYFAAMRYPMLEGRRFLQADDLRDTDVVIVNEALAQRYYANRAVGQLLTDGTGRTAEIVGVVRTRSYRALEGDLRPMVFYPMSRSKARVFYGVIRAKSGADGIEQSAAAVLNLPRTVQLEVSTFQALLSRALATDHLIVTLVGASGVVALLLAVAGVYGVMTDMVQRRRREIALRIALGAGPLQTVQTVTASVLAPALSGTAAGIGTAVLLTRIGRSFVYGVPSIDADTLALLIFGLALIVAAAVAPSALRALRVNPLAALRDT
jgi:putative ABC transport system permease protein